LWKRSGALPMHASALSVFGRRRLKFHLHRCFMVHSTFATSFHGQAAKGAYRVYASMPTSDSKNAYVAHFFLVLGAFLVSGSACQWRIGDVIHLRLRPLSRCRSWRKTSFFLAAALARTDCS